MLVPVEDNHVYAAETSSSLDKFIAATNVLSYFLRILQC